MWAGQEGWHRRCWRIRPLWHSLRQGTIDCSIEDGGATNLPKALGADSVTAISRSAAKEDALKIGADKYIATNDDKDWATHHARSLDLIVSTVSSPNMPLEQYLMLLRTNGTFIQVGAPEDRLPAFNAFSLIAKGCRIGGSAIGAPHEIEEMLELTVKKGVKPWIEKRPMKDANKTVVDMDAGKARYRYVLVNEAHA